MICEKHEYCLNRKIYNYEMNGTLQKTRHYAAFLKNAENFLFFPKYVK